MTYEGAAFNTSKLKRLYAQTHTNTHNVLVCHGYQYTAILELLRATTDFHVDGRQLRIWAEILPPTEAVSDDCEVPPDSPTTPFNETEVFATIGNASLGYLSYEAWCAWSGGCAVPHLVSFQMDDFTHDVYCHLCHLHAAAAGALTSRMRTHAPHMTLLPVVYYSRLTVRHDRCPPHRRPRCTAVLLSKSEEGAGPCANPAYQVLGPHDLSADQRKRTGGCLAGPCDLDCSECADRGGRHRCAPASRP